MQQKWKLDELCSIMAKAGAIALAQRKNPETALKADHSVVTAADREIEAYFSSCFDRPEAGSFLIGEETVQQKSEEYLLRALSGITYVVDPIDGTAPFVTGLPLWGCSIGLMEAGRLTEGAIYMPEQDELFLTCRGTLWRAIGLQSPTPEMQLFAGEKAFLSDAFPVCVSQKSCKCWQFTFPNTIYSWASCVGSYAWLLHGKLLGYLHKSKLWDLAAGMPILKAAGFSVLNEAGEEFDGVIAGSGKFELAPGPGRWCHKEHIVAAPTPECARYVWEHLKEMENGNGKK